MEREEVLVLAMNVTWQWDVDWVVDGDESWAVGVGKVEDGNLRICKDVIGDGAEHCTKDKVWTNPEFPAKLVTFTEEVHNWKIDILSSGEPRLLSGWLRFHERFLYLQLLAPFSDFFI